MHGPIIWKHGFLVMDVTVYGGGLLANIFHDLSELADTVNCQVRTTINGIPLSVSKGMTPLEVSRQYDHEAARRGFAAYAR